MEWSLKAFRAALPVLALFALGAAPAAAAEARGEVEIKEWTVPYEASRPRDPYAVSGSEVWFVGQRSDYFAKLNPEEEIFEKIDLPEGTGPHNLIVGRDGTVWIAGNLDAYIGRYDPEAGELEKIIMPDEAALDPHTLTFDEGEENIWFTVQGGNFVGRLSIADRKVDLIPVPTEGARPYGIKVGPAGTVYVALFGTNKIATVDPETLQLTEHVLPAEEARPRRLEVTAEGEVFYTDYARGYLGHLDVESGKVSEWALPSGEESKPYGSALDAKGRIWLVETGVQPNLFAGFDPETENFFSITPVPSGGGTVRHMHFHEETGAVWFGTDANTVGRADVMEK